jgi:hypothetical protein
MTIYINDETLNYTFEFHNKGLTPIEILNLTYKIRWDQEAHFDKTMIEAKLRIPTEYKVYCCGKIWDVWVVNKGKVRLETEILINVQSK